ncbi:Predicted Fe-Mo cluster-binding protein, NifX family [Caloramator fervidus]|uniref:Predicted Fe-Mo cluster-binding protein, NifX family n=1 Tax=Caloramator fervidus TaxID=29344 RepID=A0A1H5TL43_9CLOT|nr:NifB/NifX family molybdenum-iron cluster-binding protein [Caloramator fervidus]SEF63500.1 Predicted Fe-Mo cluster-binding protein, NifX family [Caloramator fervidus]
MKIAVACEDKFVSAHFGHCEGFIIYEIAEEKVVDKSFVENPGHRPGFLPVFLKELKVDVVISGGMGETAQQLFNENGIKVVVGAQGLADDVVEKYIRGELKSTGSICKEHHHEGHCND